jgi:hypothetical protein
MQSTRSPRNRIFEYHTSLCATTSPVDDDAVQTSPLLVVLLQLSETGCDSFCRRCPDVPADGQGLAQVADAVTGGALTKVALAEACQGIGFVLGRPDFTGIVESPPVVLTGSREVAGGDGQRAEVVERLGRAL